MAFVDEKVVMLGLATVPYITSVAPYPATVIPTSPADDALTNVILQLATDVGNVADSASVMVLMVCPQFADVSAVFVEIVVNRLYDVAPPTSATVPFRWFSAK
jgi:hypothetical protein